MNCRKCGANIIDGSTACPYCGELCNAPAPEPVAAPPVSVEKKPNDFIAFIKKSFIRADEGNMFILYVRKKFLALLAAAIGVIIALIIMMCLFVSLFKAIFDRADATKMVKVEQSGFNGYGSITCTIDDEALLKEAFDVKEFKDLDKDQIAVYNQLKTRLNQSIVIEGAMSELSNGDEVVITINNLDKIADDLDIKFKKKTSFTHKVKDLKDANGIALGDILDATFVGFNGGGCVELSVRGGNGMVFRIEPYTYNGVGLLIDGDCYLPLSLSGKEGSLSNGDTYTLKLNPPSDVNDYLLKNYGVFFSEEELGFRVDGLGETKEVDIFSLVSTDVSGIDGDAYLTYKWAATESTFGDIRIVTDNEDSNYFTVYRSGSTPRDAIYFKSDSGSSGSSEESLGSFNIYASKTNSISSGDVIELSITSSSYYYDDEFNTAALAQKGLAFTELTKTITVDGSALDRYITSDSQISAESLKALSVSLTDQVEQYLMDNWSRIVHNSNNFTCYDQTLNSPLRANTAYFGCSDKGSNEYTIWLPFACTVIDSELEGPKAVYFVATVRKPMVSNDGTIKCQDYYGASVDNYKDEASILESRWHENTEGLKTYQLK